jgi:hypothetical protein
MKALAVVHGIVLFIMLIVAVTLSAIEASEMHVAWKVFVLSFAIVGTQWAAVAAGADMARRK